MEAFINAEKDANVAPDLDQNKEISEIVSFIKDRIVKQLKADKIRHDIIDAAGNSNNDNIEFIFNVADILNEHKEDDNFKESVEALTRVLRISEKQDFSADDLNVDESLFENDSEKNLHSNVEAISGDFFSLSANDEYNKLFDLKDSINDYFDQTMVMAKDENVKNNHLRELTKLSNMINWFADLNQLIVK